MTARPRRHGAIRLGTSVALCLLVAAAAAEAGSVRVRVTDQDGVPLRGIRVRLEPLDLQGGRYDRFNIQGNRVTDASGRAALTGLGVGQWRVSAYARGGEFVAPEQNPLAAPVTFTIEQDGSRVSVELQLHRGTQLCLKFHVDGTDRPVGARAILNELENGHRTEQALPKDEERCVPLFAGRWNVALDPPDGYLLVDVEEDGRSVAGSQMTLDVRAGQPTRFITWHFVAQARLSGRVTFSPGYFPTQVVAQLLQPGPWEEAARRRGGSDVSSVAATVNRYTGLYRMDLPGGLWRVAPRSAQLLESSPPQATLELQPGDDRGQDFDVEGEIPEDDGALVVRVRRPDGKSARGAVVELWPLDASLRDDEPLDRRRVRGWSATVRFPGVPAGSYLAVAGLAGWVEGQRTIQDHDPEEPRSYEVKLRRGGRLHVVFGQPKEGADTDAPSPVGATVRLQRQGGKPDDMILADPALVSLAESPATEVDSTRQAWIRGIYPGSYDLTADLSDGFVRFLRDGAEEAQIEVTFRADETVEIAARTRPAARVAATIFCRDGEPLPPNVDLRVVDSRHRPTDPLDETWLDEVWLGRDEVPLVGDHHDRFVLGPLETSSYLLSLRPATFDRWTWALGTEDGAAAASFETTDGELVELGALRVECGPAIRVRPRVAGGIEAPGLDEIGPRFENFTIAGRVESDSGDVTEVERVDVDRYRRMLLVRNLPEGQADLRLLLGHDHFLPDYWRPVTASGDLRRGTTLDVWLELPDVGGALDVLDPTGRALAVRVLDGEGAIVRLEPLVEGRARVGNLPAAPYRVELCADAACQEVVREQSAEVERRVTQKLFD